ncbi:MAG: serine/threonine-protein kinase [Gracilimonas sp.]
MDRITWAHIEDLADKALELPPDKREEFLKYACADNPNLQEEALSLLQNITESEGWLENPVDFKEELFKNIPKDLKVLDATETLLGKKVGSYTIKKEIGKGGMGTVFLAERSDGFFDHKVAIKIINQDRTTKENIERFRQERNILAELNHPGIAQIYDGGITDDGIPYFIMEYIDGVPITDYCIQKRLSLSDRIELFKKVLKAVQHAHENLVIHRDFKPENILVTDDGDIKILDFGISKLLRKGVASQIGEIEKPALTISFAAPEQIKNQPVTTATDIYALGLVFYKSLTNNFPYSLNGLSLAEAHQKILSYKFIPLNLNIEEGAGIKARELKGDLEFIVLKALQKNTRKRYRSANDLLSDLKKFERKFPVSACDKTLWYLSGKYIQRNIKGLSVTALVLTLIVSFTLFYTWRITEQKEQAQLAATKAEEVSDFLIQLFEASDPASNLGNVFTTRELLMNGVQQSEQLSSQPLLQARLFDITGQVYRNIGDYDQAKYLIENAISLREKNLGYYHPLTLSSRHNLGLVMNDMGNFHEAENIFQLVYDQRNQTLGDEHIETASTLSNLAYSIRRQGDYVRAEELARKSLSIFLNDLGPDNIQTLDIMNKLAITLHNKGEYQEAEDIYLQVLEKRREQLGSPHPELAKSINNLAALYLNTGAFENARTLMKEALDIHKELFGPVHPNVATVLNNLGLVHTELNEYETAGEYFLNALEMRIDLLGEGHTNTAVSMFSIGGLMLRTNRPDSAINTYNKAVPIFESELAEDHSFTVHSKLGIGRALAQKGRLKEAEPYFVNSFDRIKEIHQSNSIERAMAEYHVGSFYLKIEKNQLADSLLNSSHEALKLLEGDNGKRQQQVFNTLEELKKRTTSQGLMNSLFE